MMSTYERRRALRAVYEAVDVLDRLWDEVPVDDGSDPELNRVIGGPVLAAESHLWEARAQFIELVEEEKEK